MCLAFLRGRAFCPEKGLHDSTRGFNPISANLIKASTGFVPEGQHDRSQARSAWNSANPKSRPVGYGMIRVGVRTDSTWLTFPRDIPLELAAPDHTVPYGTVHLRDTSQALRAWLRSACPSGTKAIRPIEGPRIN
jgi:hypothetical protein